MDFIKKYSTEKPSTYAEFDFETALLDLWDIIPDKSFSYATKIRFELEYLGYAQTLAEELSPNYVMVTEMEQSYGNRLVTLHTLCDGTTEKVKVRGKAF